MQVAEPLWNGSYHPDTDFCVFGKDARGRFVAAEIEAVLVASEPIQNGLSSRMSDTSFLLMRDGRVMRTNWRGV